MGSSVNAKVPALTAGAERRQHTKHPGRSRRNSVATYYAHLASCYNEYSQGTFGWHWGIWESDTKTHRQALLRSNEYLLRGLEISPSTRILDVGCGAGGFAIWAAARYGCEVTGVTVCAANLPFARQQAIQAGVAAQCRFLEMDLNDLTFPDSAFDVVVNQETFCYARNVERYLATVCRLLRRGGVWCCIDSFPGDSRSRSVQRTTLQRMAYRGFHFGPLASEARVDRALRGAAFVAIRSTDLTKRVLARPLFVSAQDQSALAMLSLFGDGCFSGSAAHRRLYYDHFRAGWAFITAIQHGYLKHVFYRARRAG